jgi:hypothetical protein
LFHGPLGDKTSPYVIVLRIVGHFVLYAPAATERNPSVLRVNTLLLDINPVDGRVLDLQPGRDLPDLSALGVVRSLYEHQRL